MVQAYRVIPPCPIEMPLDNALRLWSRPVETRKWQVNEIYTIHPLQPATCLAIVTRKLQFHSKPLLFFVSWTLTKLLIRSHRLLPIFLRLDRPKTPLRISEDFPPGRASFWLTIHATCGQFCHSTALLTLHVNCLVLRRLCVLWVLYSLW